jgi:hypothetical protein
MAVEAQRAYVGPTPLSFEVLGRHRGCGAFL